MPCAGHFWQKNTVFQALNIAFSQQRLAGSAIVFFINFDSDLGIKKPRPLVRGGVVIFK